MLKAINVNFCYVSNAFCLLHLSWHINGVKQNNTVGLYPDCLKNYFSELFLCNSRYSSIRFG